MSKIADKFMIEKRLGSGSFGDVYKGVTSSGAEVAIKMEDGRVT